MTKREQQYNKLFIRLSGHFLSAHLDDNFWDLDYETEQLTMIEKYSWEPFDYHDGSYVYNLIENLTEEVMSILEKGE